MPEIDRKNRLEFASGDGLGYSLYTKHLDLNELTESDHT